MLGLIGGGAMATNVTANADTNNNQNNNANQNTIRQRLNQNLASNSSHLQRVQQQQHSNAGSSITQQANALHSRILASNFNQSGNAQSQRSAKSNQNTDSAIASQNSDSQVLNSRTQNIVGRTKKAPTNPVGDSPRNGSYKGLNYTYDPVSKTVEFTDGNLDWSNYYKNKYSQGFIGYNKAFLGDQTSAPTDLKKAQHIIFDSDIDVSTSQQLSGFIQDDTAAKTIDLGKNFINNDVQHWAGNDETGMFQSDYNLQELDVPQNLVINTYNNTATLLESDNNLTKFVVYPGSVPKYEPGFVIGHQKNSAFNGTWYSIGDIHKSHPISLASSSNIQPGTYITSKYRVVPRGSDWTNLHEGTANVEINGNTDTIAVSDGTLSDANSHSISGNNYTEFISDIRNHNGDLITSDTLPNQNKDWKITFSNVTAPSNMGFVLSGGKNSSHNENVLGNQVSNIRLDGLNFGNTTSMQGMLMNSNNLKCVEFPSDIDTRKVTDMSMMLGSDSDLQSVDLSNLSGQSLNQAWDLFDTDYNLQSVTLSSKFSPQGSNVDLGEMFASDPSLTSINWGGFNTQNATQIYGMFRGDKSLANSSNNYTITLPSTFDTSKVINMGNDIKNGSNRDGVFQSDFAKGGHAGTIDLSTDPSFSLQSAKSLQGLFSSDKSLTNINFGNNFDTSNVSDMGYMFGLSDGISDLNLPSGFDTSNVNNMASMFESDVLTKSDGNGMTDSTNSNGTDGRLKTITINSSQTKFNNSVWAWGTHNLYPEAGYNDNTGRPVTKTHATPNDFSQGNTGTFTLKNESTLDRVVFETSDGTPVNQTYIYGYEGDTADENGNKNGYSDTHNPRLDFNVPNGYSLSQKPNVNPSSITMGKFNNRRDNAEFRTHVLIVDSNPSNDIPIGENAVDLEGTVNLHFRNSKGDTITNIPLNYFTQAIPKQSPVNVLTALNLLSSKQSNNITAPSDLLNGSAANAIENLYNGNNLNLKGFSYDASDSNDRSRDHPYDITVNANNDNYFHGSTPVQQNNVDLYFTANNVSQKINYIYDNSVKGTCNTDSNLIGKPYDSTYKVSDLKEDTTNNKVPAGYSISSDNPSDVTINGGTTDINVVPDSKTVNVEYDNKNNHKVGSDNGLQVHTGSDIEPNNVPTGYHISSNQQLPLVVTASDNNSSHPIKVSVVPNANEHEVINYYYNYNGKNILAGSAYLTGIYNKSDDITNGNKPGLNSDYQLKYSDNKFTYGTANNDNGNNQQSDFVDQDVINVAVVPKPKGTSYQFVTPISNNGETVIKGKDGHSTDNLGNGNPSDAIKVSNISITGNVPTGYHIVDSDQQIPYDGQLHSILITPNYVTDHVNFMNGSTKLNDTTIKGLYSDQVNPDNVPNVPEGYHIIPNQSNITLNGGNHDLKVMPNVEHEVINYYYNGSNGKKVLAGVNYKTGLYNTSSDATLSNQAPGLDSGYQLINSSNPFKYGQNGDSDVIDVQVKPVQKGTTIKLVTPENNKGSDYQQVGSTINIGNGNPSDAIKMSDNNITSQLSSSHYHIVDTNQVIYHDGQTHDIVVAPNEVTDTINYKTSDNASTNVGNSNYSGLYNDKFSPNALTDVPNGYHLQPNQGDIDLDSGTHTVLVAPNQYKDTIIYVDGDHNKNNGNTLGSYITNDGDFNKQLAEFSYVPAGYTVMGNHTEPNYDGQTHVIWVTGNLVGPGNSHPSPNSDPKNGAGPATNTQPSGTNSNYYVHVHINGYQPNDSSSRPTVSDNEYIPISGNVGSDVVLDPINYAPRGGYAMSSSDQNADVDIVDGDQGLDVSGSNWNNNTITWNYHQSQQDNNMIVEYVDGKGSSRPILETGVISGSNGAHGSVTSKVSVPNGYSIINDTSDNDQNGNPQYTLTNTPQTYIIHVQGNQVTTNNTIHVTEIYKNGNNVTYSSEHDVAVSDLKSLSNSDEPASRVGQPYFVKAPASEHQGYSVDASDATLKGVITPNGVSHASVTFVYDANSVNGKINFVDPSDHPINVNPKKPLSGNVGSDINSNDYVPNGYHVIPGQHPTIQPNGDSTNIKIQGDGVVGQAKLNLVYENGNQIVDQKTISVPISGRIGDGPQTISPWNPLYSRDGYKLISSDNSTSDNGGVKDWSIPFNVNSVESNGNTDTFRYTPTNTFTYQATPIDVQVKYIDVDDGNKQINNTDDLGTIGIKGQILDLKNQIHDQNGSNQPGNGDNSEVVNVNGHSYHLTIPTGYHLVNSDNYMTIMPSKKSNGAIETNSYGQPVMLLTLGLDAGAAPAKPNKPVTPNNKPNSSGNHTPNKPASNGGGNNPINPNPRPNPNNNGGNNNKPINPNHVPNQPNNNGGNNNNNQPNNHVPNVPNIPINPMPNPQPTPNSVPNNNNSQASIGQVMVTYVDGENHVIDRTSVSGTTGSAFQPSSYVALVPSGYHADHIVTGSRIASFNNGTQNLVIQVDKDQDPQPASASDHTPQPANNSNANVPAASSSNQNISDFTPASSGSVAPSSSAAPSSSSNNSDGSTANSTSNSANSSSAKPASSSSQSNSAANSNNSNTNSDTNSDSDGNSDSNSDVPSDNTNSDTGNDGATSSSHGQASATGNSTDGGTTNTGADEASSNEANANGTSGTDGSSSKLPQTGENNYSKSAALAMLSLDAIIGGLGLGRKRRRHDE